MDFLTPSVEAGYEQNAAPAIDTKTDRRKTRWVVFCGDDLSTDFKEKFQGAQIGGMYFGHDLKCLHLTKHLMRRCEITPFVIGYDYLNTDSLGGDTTKAVTFSEWNEHTRSMETRYAYECLPADELESVLSAMQGPFDVGVREVESLLGVEEPKPIKNAEGRTTGYTPSKGTQMQRVIFPEWDKYVSGEVEFFPTIDALRQYLLTRYEQVTTDAQKVIEVMMASNDQFERWATERLSEKGNLVKAPVTAEGRVYSWNGTDFRRFKQTGLNREEFLMQKPKDPVENQGVTRDELLTMFAPLKQFMDYQVGKEEAQQAKSDLAPETPVSIEGKSGQIVEKKGGGYYAVKFDDGTEGNFRSAQFD